MFPMPRVTGLALVVAFLVGCERLPTTAEKPSEPNYSIVPGSGGWSIMAPMPTPRLGVTTVALAGQLYVISGIGPTRGDASNAVEVYDAVSNTWTTRASTPFGVTYGGAAAINNKLYVVGGCGFDADCGTHVTNALLIYDPATNTWTSGAAMPTARFYPAVGAIGGKLYVTGGAKNGNLSSLEIYDPATNSWSTGAPLPLATGGAGAVLDGKLYVVGGATPGVLLATVQVYDPTTNTWSSAAPMQVPRDGLGATSLNGILYAIGGADQLVPGVDVTTRVEAFEPATNTWTVLASMPVGKSGPQPQAINGVIYVAGSAPGNDPSSVLEAFTPPPITTSPQIFDAVLDFSTTTNTPSSTWSYRYQNGRTRDGNYLLLTTYGLDVSSTFTPTQPAAWRGTSPVPVIGVNLTGSDATLVGTNLVIPKGAMWAHPGSNDLVVLSWLAPSTAAMNIRFSFSDLHGECGDGIQWYVERNNSTMTLSSGSLLNYGNSGQQTLSSISVSAGDRINFIVDPGGNYGCDSTQLTATIEPSSPGGSGGTGQTNTCVTSPSGIVSWWKGEGNAADAVDGNGGTLHGSATFAAGQVGQAFLLDGVSANVDFGNAPNLHVSTGDFTVEAWVRFNAETGDMSIVDKMSASGVNTDGWRLLKQSDNRFWFCLGGGNDGGNRCGNLGASYDQYTVRSTTAATNLVWYHVAAVNTARSFSLYVNGALEDNRVRDPNFAPFLDTQSANLRIGSNALEGAYLNGEVDEVAIYNRALSSAEIAAIFAAGNGGKCPPVSPATVILDAASLDHTYDGTPKVATVTTSPANLTGVTLTYDGSTTPPVNAGSYAVVAHLTHAGYTASDATGTLVVHQRPIQVTADAKSKVYGDPDPAFTYHVTGGSLVNGDSFAGNVFPRHPETVSTYTIFQGTLSAGPNYNLTYVEGYFTISQRPITVTADAKTKTFGDADPALTYRITSGSLAFTDGFSGGLNRASGEGVGTYAISQGSLKAGTLNDYDMTFVGSNLTITQASPLISWSAPASTVYGTVLGGAQLNATAIGVGGTALNGSFTYSPAAGTVLSPGSQTLSVSFTPDDRANYRGATKSVSISVLYNTTAGHSDLQPINPPGQPMSVFKIGSTIPVKFQLFLPDAVTPVSTAVASIQVNKISDGVPSLVNESVISTTANQGLSFRYDASSAQYVFNLGTKGWASGTYQITVILDDGSSIVVNVGAR
jgi:N-acetylneuraminic acid mutarotase